MRNKDLYIQDTSMFVGTKPERLNTLYICAKKVVIKEDELNIEIDLKNTISKYDRIVVDGIRFVKERE